MGLTKETVLEQFENGYDCAQVVFGYWAEKFGIDRETAYKISTGFGAGMLQGETCGAIIGAYMALGLKFGVCETGTDGEEQKVASVIKNAQFREEFLKKYSSTMCKELLEADFATPEGAKKIRENKLMTTFCPKLVSDVMDILDEIME